MKIIRNIVIFLVIATILTVGGLLMYSNGRTYFNDASEIGNTMGNIYNGGLFCEQDDRIYFSNDVDDGSLYVMDSLGANVRKVYDDKAVFINADDNYLYYVRANNTRENQKGNLLMFYNTGVFRINQNGKDLKAFTGNPGAYLMLYGNNIYFQRYDAEIGLYLYTYQIDAKKERLLLEDAVVPAMVDDNSLLYTGYSKDHNINFLDLSSYTHHTKIEGNIYYPIFIGDYIYYINLEEHNNIYRMNKDGSDPIPVIKDKVSTYNITNDGKYLIYQVDDGKHNRICRYNLETLQDETLKKGDYKQIHVTDHFVFFKDFDNTKTYVISSTGAASVSTFKPVLASTSVSPAPTITPTPTVTPTP